MINRIRRPFRSNILSILLPVFKQNLCTFNFMHVYNYATHHSRLSKAFRNQALSPVRSTGFNRNLRLHSAAIPPKGGTTNSAYKKLQPGEAVIFSSRFGASHGRTAIIRG